MQWPVISRLESKLFQQRTSCLIELRERWQWREPWCLGGFDLSSVVEPPLVTYGPHGCRWKPFTTGRPVQLVQQ